jgi:ethanolamine ammonia-lyase large subunit
MSPDELRRTLVLANGFKEGDLAVGGTRDDAMREDARRVLRATTLAAIDTTPLVDDGVTDALTRAIDRQLQAKLGSLTIARLTAILLGSDGPEWVSRYRGGLSSEVIAAVAKVMTSDELSSVARRLFNPLPGRGVTIGSPNHFGSRIQPNSPGDRDDEILFSTLEGLASGCGDVVIGLNPASDDVDTIVRLEELLRGIVERLRLPTRYCVLSDLRKQDAARARARVDVGFQSLAGTSKALAGMVALDADGVLDLSARFPSLYFETGQGSAVTNGAAEGVDMVTLESRAYGLARAIGQRTDAWMIVNDVAGFIGPEVFRTPEQLERACLEDAVMAKLHGLTMGLDVCATFHMAISPATLRALTALIVEQAAPGYLMAVAGNADPMLGYLTTSFDDHRRLRHRATRGPASAMRQRLSELGVDLDASRAIGLAGADLQVRPYKATSAVTASLYATYAKAGGDTRTASALEDEARRLLAEMRGRGFELGDDGGGSAANRRVDAIYEHARAALHATLDEGVIREACPAHTRVSSTSVDRDDYLAHPPHGERLRREHANRIASLYEGQRPPQVQFVISDGLNANAVNEQLRALLPPVRRELSEAGLGVGTVDVVVRNGRVRAGYHVGELLDALAVVHFIGERPGTGLNTLSAYVSYGRDMAGRSRWGSHFDHSWTTAICGIHARGKPVATAVDEVASVVVRAIASGRSGVALSAAR